jgi:alpha-tubulin suppressor-like RCC1 family protein
VPGAVEGLADVRAIASGWWTGYAVLRNGTLRSWGWNVHGAVGDGTTETRLSPVQVVLDR